MKASGILIILTLLAVPTVFIGAQSPHQIKTEGISINRKAHILVLEALKPYPLYEGVVQDMYLPAGDRRNPCFKGGQMRIASEDCQVQNDERNSFRILPLKAKGALHFYLDTEGKCHDLGTFAFYTIPCDTNNPDFRKAYANKQWRPPLDYIDNFDPSTVEVIETHPYFFNPGRPLLNGLSRSKPNAVQILYSNNCEPSPEILPEGEGIQAVRTGKWNQFTLTVIDEARTSVDIQFYTLKEGKKTLLEELTFPVFPE